MNNDVTTYIEKAQDWQAEICTPLRALVLENVPDVEERLQYGKPHYLKGKNYVAVIGTAKGWVSFTIFNAADLNPPDGLFEDGPPERRTIKIKPGADVDYALLGELLKQAADTL